jgi:hypothetical protein
VREIAVEYLREHSAEEFAPLAFYPWDTRPLTVPLDVDECATALFLSRGDINAAAALLKVSATQFKKMVRRHPRLQRLRDDLAGS